MIEIQGTFATAKCFAQTVNDNAIEQIRTMCNTPVTEGSQVRIMPDVHAGKGCTIGTTMTIHGRAVPNVVGVDIGCGMYTVRLDAKEIDFAKVDEAAHIIPSGMHTWKEPIEPFDLTALRCHDHLKKKNWLACSLGTLGGGNHFIEIDKGADDTFYLVIHSGSRNLGKQVAELYQQMAIDYHEGKPKLFVNRDELIAQMKAEGRNREIQKALKALEQPTRELTVPAALCWLEGAFLQDYLHDVDLCQRFALRSRELMAQKILKHTGMTGSDGFHTIHNYIDTTEMILRKGAIAAHAGEKVLIPINMRDGSILATGRGNPDWNFSAPHGAGRLMSRTDAFKTLTMEDYKASMQGIYTTSVQPDTLDEAPMAYKSLDEILDMVQDSVDVIDILKPVYNFKAAE
ncbi:MAG: RtcB family protein [Clostridia bacterium]|nr:RtcB family protein [Clostridia bacterium]